MHLALLPRAAGAISSPWRMALTLAVSLGAIRMVQTVVEDAVSGATTGLPPFQLRVRLLWIRHGLSCANILNACAVGAGAKDVEELMPQLEAALHALPNYTWPAGEQCRLEKNYGLQPRPPEGKDCTVEVLQADSQRFVTKLHLLLDPLLTDCSKRQSEEAGQALLHFLSKHGMRLHLIASSTLLRAIQTAYHMFVAPCVDGGSSCSVLATNLTVMPVPFVAERCKSKQPLQADNFAAPLPLQKELLAQYLKFVQLERFQDWPRLEQQFAKFKAFLALLLLPSLRIAETEQLERLPATLLHSLLEDPSATSFSELNWPGGSYREGPSFKRMEYDAMEAPEVVVALLGHGGMISKFCHLEASPQNNEVLEKLFIIETPTAGSTIMRELTGRCPTLMTAPQPELHHLSRADVDSCHVGFDVRQFLDLAKEGQCKASQSSYHFPFDSFDAVTLDI